MALSSKIAWFVLVCGCVASAQETAPPSMPKQSRRSLPRGLQIASVRKDGPGKGPHRTGTSNPPPAIQQPAPPTPAPQAVPYTPPPLRPAQMPAVTPRISYQNGQLTVVAENSNLSDVLNAIRTATGVRIESSGGSGPDRIAAKIGPAPVRDVLLSLLEGSRYDFIMLGSEADPNRVERVLLTPKSTGNAPGASTASSSPQPSGVVTPDMAAQPAENESDDEDNNEGFAPAPAQPNQPQQPGASVPAGLHPGAPAQPDQGVKSPEQLLEDLRRMEQERQGQQSPQNQPAHSPDQLQRPPRTERPQ